MLTEHTLEIRVRYSETDGQRRVHHAQYLNYFERGRVELLRAMGHSYRDLEDSGLLLVVSELTVRYLGAAQFDDMLSLTTRVVRSRGVRIHHTYELSLLDESSNEILPIVEASSVIACINREGKVKPLPDYLLGDARMDNTRRQSESDGSNGR